MCYRYELPHSRPAACWWALFDQPMISIADAVGFPQDERRLFCFSRRGDFFLQAGGEGPAVVAYGAEQTLWVARRADGGAEFHQGGIEIADAFAGEDFFGSVPKLGAGLWIARVGSDAIEPAEDALDVAVEDWSSFVEGEGGDGAGRVSADAGKGLQHGHGIGDAAVVHGDDGSCRRLEVAGPGVIAQALPRSEDMLLVGAGQRGEVWKLKEETVEIRNDCADLRLLEHRFADEDVIRVGERAQLDTPRQCPAGAVVPAEKLAGECGARNRHG